MSNKSLAIDLIRTDGGTQMRAELNKDVYLDYRDKILAGVEFPPLDVFHDGSAYWLADGFHRFYGAREAKKASVKATVHSGTQRDAILFAVGANTAHGLRRSNPDKRNCVLALLNDPEWVKWSDRKIAEQAGVGNALVGEVRKQLFESNSSSPAATAKDEPRIGKDGKKRKPPKARKKKPEPPAEPDEDDDPNEHVREQIRNEEATGNINTPPEPDWNGLLKTIVEARRAADTCNKLTGRKGKFCDDFQTTCGILDDIVRDWRKATK